MASCAECKNLGKQICTVCSNYMGFPDQFKPKAKTNGDKVRGMTDRELAMIIGCQNNKQGDECFDASCFECTLEWLQMEAGE